MKNITLIFVALFATLFASAQFSNKRFDTREGVNVASAKTTKSNTKAANSFWELQLNKSTGNRIATGSETDGTYIYITQWNSAFIFKYDLTGALLDSFSIPGVAKITDLTYDGTYFYGANQSNIIYKMDFTTKTVTGTILVPTITTALSICYDATADGGNGGFWVAGNPADLQLINRTGSVLRTIPAATHGLTNFIGIAYDPISVGGPYIWANSTTATADGKKPMLFQINVATGKQTGLIHDLTTDNIAQIGDYAGGLWIFTNLVAGTTTLGGSIQNKSFFGFNLAKTTIALDLEVSSVTIPNMVANGTALDIKAPIINNGTTPITTFSISYSVDGGTPITENSTTTIPPYSTGPYTFTTPYTMTNGVHNITVSVSNVNGSAVDSFPSNDSKTAKVTGYDPSAAVQRIPLYETFTSSTCGPCVNGNLNMDALFDANPNKWTCVKYQMSWPGYGDPYYTSEGEVRRGVYKVSGVPTQEIDGGYDGNSGSVVQSDFDNAYANPAFMEISANMTLLFRDKVQVDYTLTPKIEYPSGSKLYIAIVEKKTVKNVGTNGETQFFNVMKKMLPDANGTAVSLVAGTPVTGTIIYQFNGSYRLPANAGSPINNATENSVEDFTNLVAVVWVQDPITLEVYQSAFSTVTVGINKEKNIDNSCTVYPNPVSDVLNINMKQEKAEKAEISLYNNIGQIVYTNSKTFVSGENNFSINTANYTSGVYILKIKSENSIITKQVVIK